MLSGDLSSCEKVTKERDGREWNEWWLLPCPAFAAIAPFLALIQGESFDVDVILYTFLGVPFLSLVVALALLAAALITNRTPHKVYFGMFPVYWAFTTLLFMNQTEMRLQTRWLLYGHKLKASIQRQAAPTNGELRHAEFDGWGWAGMDSTEYLVFDPNDKLASAASQNRSGSYLGIPCKVPLVRRMERNWYIVPYYANADWNRCE